jgi:hypothetical protein
MEIREHAITEKGDIFDRIYAISGMETFTHIVFGEIGVVVRHPVGNKPEISRDPSDPEKMSDISTILRQPTKMYPLDNSDHVFCIQDPHTEGKNMEDFYLVADKEANKKLTQYVLDHPLLLRYFMATRIRHLQNVGIQQINSVISNVENTRTKESEATSDYINNQVTTHALSLIFKESETQPVILTHLHREGYGTPDNPGSPDLADEVFVHTYTIKQINTTTREFELTSLYAKRDGKKIVKDLPHHSEKILVEKQPDGTFRYKNVETEKTSNSWHETPRTIKNSHMANLFELFKVASPIELRHFKDLNKSTLPAQVLARKLCATHSLAELLPLLREEGVLNFPNEDIALNAAPVALIPPNPDSVKNN